MIYYNSTKNAKIMKKLVLLIGLCAFYYVKSQCICYSDSENQSLIVLSNDDPPQKAENKKAKAETVAPNP
jgi:hypothetical protein